MTDDATLDALLAAYRSGAPQPEHMVGTLAMDDAYAMQVRLLRRLRGAGARHTGWKIGQTSTAMRAERGETQPAPGFLLADGAGDDGGATTLTGDGTWFLEPELAFVVGREIAGPGITQDMVADSLASMHPAFELVKRVPGWDDRALQRAVNATNAGYVLGPAWERKLNASKIDDIHVRLVCDGAEIASIRGGDVNDNPLQSTAWLANYLEALGESLQPGQVILTGSYTALLPLEPGQSWRAWIGAGEVALTTA